MAILDTVLIIVANSFIILAIPAQQLTHFQINDIHELETVFCGQPCCLGDSQKSIAPCQSCGILFCWRLIDVISSNSWIAQGTLKLVAWSLGFKLT